MLASSPQAPQTPIVPKPQVRKVLAANTPSTAEDRRKRRKVVDDLNGIVLPWIPQTPEEEHFAKWKLVELGASVPEADQALKVLKDSGGDMLDALRSLDLPTDIQYFSTNQVDISSKHFACFDWASLLQRQHRFEVVTLGISISHIHRVITSGD
jgi:hypothetical protein